MKTPKLSLLTLILLLFFISSCVKDEYKFQNLQPSGWDPNFAAPILNSKLTLWNLINDVDSNFLHVDNNGFITLTYSKVLFSEVASSVVIIPNQVFNFNTSFTNPGQIPVGDSIVLSYDTFYNFVLESGQTVDSVYLKNGSFDILINSNFNVPSKVVLEVHGATRNGIPLKDTIELNTPNSFNSISLQNTKLTFTQIGGTNRLDYTIKIIQYGDGSPDLSPYNFDMRMTYANIDFQGFYGYVGQMNFELIEDTMKLNINNNIVQGTFNINDPRVTLTTKSSFGIPMQTNIQNLDFIRLNPNYQKVSLTGFPNPWNINSPSVPGQEATTIVSLNNTNSNLATAINIVPQRVVAQISASTNAAGPTQNFLFDNSKFEVEVKVEFPLYGSLNNITMTDTVPMTFNIKDKDIDFVDWILVKVMMENKFPLDVDLQVYFYDDNMNFIDSLLSPSQQLLFAGMPGPAPDYRVTNPSKKSLVVKIEKNRLKEYNKITKAIIIGNISTANQGSPAKFYTDYDIKLQIGAQIKLNVNLN